MSAIMVTENNVELPTPLKHSTMLQLETFWQAKLSLNLKSIM